MANKIFIQDPQLNIAASVPAAVNIGVQNVDTSSPIIGQFGQMLAQMVGQYQANKQQIDYADMQFELDQLEKQWHLNNTADPNVYKTEESRGNLLKSYNELLLKRQDIVNTYRDRIGDENYYNYTKELQSKVSDEMVSIQTGINQGFIGEEYTRAVRRIDNNLDKVNDYKNVFNANDGALVLMRGHNLAASSLKYLNADDNETVYKGYENYFGTLQNSYKTKFIQDLYDNFSDGNGALDIDAVKSYVEKNRVETLSDDNIKPVAKELYKSSPNLFNDEQDAFNYVKKKYEDTLNEIDKFVSKRKVEKEKDQAMMAIQNTREILRDANADITKAQSGDLDMLDGTVTGNAVLNKVILDRSYANNKEYIGHSDPRQFMQIMDASNTRYYSAVGNQTIKDRYASNMANALAEYYKTQPDKYNPYVFSQAEYDAYANMLERDIYNTNPTYFDASSNPSKARASRDFEDNFFKETERRTKAYNKLVNYEQDKVVDMIRNKMLTETNNFDYMKSFFTNSLVGNVQVKRYNAKTKKDEIVNISAKEWFRDEFGIDFSKSVSKDQFYDFVRKDGKRAIALIRAGYDDAYENGANIFNSNFPKYNPDNNGDLNKIANAYIYLPASDNKDKGDKKAFSIAVNGLGNYMGKYNNIVTQVNNNANTLKFTMVIDSNLANQIRNDAINSKGGVTQEAFNKYMKQDVIPQSEIYRTKYNQGELKGQDKGKKDEQTTYTTKTNILGDDISQRVLSKYKKIDKNQNVRGVIYKTK